MVPSRNTIKVSGEKARSKRKTNSIKGKAHKNLLLAHKPPRRSNNKMMSFDITLTVLPTKI